jgi:hypothetical protein
MLKSILLVLTAYFCPAIIFAQVQHPPQLLPTPSKNKIQAPSQQEANLTFHFSADVMTALESLRLNTQADSRITSPDGATTTVIRKPVYDTVHDLVDDVLRHGLIQSVLNEFPPASLKSKIDALAAAQKEKDDASAAAVAATPK